MSPADGWKESHVEIPVPDGTPHSSDEQPPTFSIPGLHHRSLVQIIKATWSDESSRDFHCTPFRQLWQRDPSSEVERVHDEIYSSDAFIEAYTEVQQLPAEPGCTLERTVCAMMFWSDSTHLANFGTASLWPLYLFFGNLSKYARAHPHSGACHHAAYIPKLPDTFYDFFETLTGAAPTDDILTHCRRELMHAIWMLLLDNEFLHAYRHGIVIRCADGITRRVYPRILTYSADYPEKVLLATIRNFGACPCPRCKIPKSKLHELGMHRDDVRRERDARQDNGTFRDKVKIARRAVYELGKGVKSVVVERLLAEESCVPVENAFSSRLSSFGFNFFRMLVVDLMHEFELGVWKMVFIHLVRILVEYGDSTVQELNRRYRLVPTFGRATIRRFSNNASAMKKLAARDFEDLLQCSIPVFEGLLPEPHNKIVLDLLFALSEWQAEAKLRMHTDSSLKLLANATTFLGAQLRRFAMHTCSYFDTKELPREAAARGRRMRRKSAKQSNPTNPTAPASSRSTRKVFSLLTYKLHALGDYVRQIRWFGTTDSYSTQPGELEHRHVKRFYARTNKNNAVRQMTALQRREQMLGRLMRGNDVLRRTPTGRMRRTQTTVSFEEQEPLRATPPDQHHHISHSRNFPIHLSTLMSSLQRTCIGEEFLPQLQDHLLERIHHPNMASEGRRYTPGERLQLIIQNDRVFVHKVLRINYTTYDVRRGQDSMNPRTHANVMTLADGNPQHPFRYARVLGVFHADVLHHPVGSTVAMQSVDFLFVRWFQYDMRWKGGFKTRRLHRIKLLPDKAAASFGFLDPDDVIREAHLIPAFAHGQTEQEWNYHYVNMFADRDIFMRYAGLGVGHSYRIELPADEVWADEVDDDDVENARGGENAAPTEDHEVAEIETDLDSDEDNSGNAGNVAGDGERDRDTDTEDEEEYLGPEDGEGGLDVIDEEGYGDL